MVLLQTQLVVQKINKCKSKGQCHFLVSDLLLSVCNALTTLGFAMAPSMAGQCRIQWGVPIGSACAQCSTPITGGPNLLTIWYDELHDNNSDGNDDNALLLVEGDEDPYESDAVSLSMSGPNLSYMHGLC
jgi:hypothetical protein